MCCGWRHFASAGAYRSAQHSKRALALCVALQVLWVLGFPELWSQAERRKMRNAAERAGMQVRRLFSGWCRMHA